MNHTPMAPLREERSPAPARPAPRRRTLHWVALVIGLLPSLPVLAWAVLGALAPDPSGQTADQGAAGQVLGWVVVLLPVSIGLGLILAAVTYLLGFLLAAVRRRPR